MLKLSIAPSSTLLSWDVVVKLLGLQEINPSMWRPTERARKTKPIAHDEHVPCFTVFSRHNVHVHETYHEASKLPLMSMLLVDAVDSYAPQELIILPQAKIIKEYRTDYAVCIAIRHQDTPVSVC